MEQVISSSFDHSEWAVLASGADYPDALTALALAGAHHAPVVLTAPDALSAQAASELRRLGCTKLVCVGGPAAVSDAALDEARSIVGSARRILGPNRYATATEVLKETRSASSSSDTVIVATGTTFADALSAGPWSWHTASPVALARPDGTLTDETVEAIRADAGLTRVVIMGGEAAVSESVRTQLGDGYTYVRLAGADRYQTSSAAATWFTQHGLGWSKPFVATGTGFADALSSASAAGAASSPLLLVNPTSQTVPSELTANRQSLTKVTIVGGTSAVSGSFEDALRSALR
jgi:putative cell wall-binding protein